MSEESVDSVHGGAGWREAFIAMSVALGEDVEVAIAALGDAGACGGEIVRELTDKSRSVRAKALALAMARMAQSLDAMELE